MIFLNMKMKYVAHDIVAYIFIKMANNNWSHGKKIIELSKMFIGWSAKRSNYYILCRVCCTLYRGGRGKVGLDKIAAFENGA
jgi:hypothetical protein